MKFWNRTLATVALAMVTATGAQAVPVSFEFFGTVNVADAGNAFGLGVGDIVSMNGTFDDADVPASGIVELGFGSGSGRTLNAVLGAITLVESNDSDFQNGIFPTLTFNDGALVMTNFVTEIGINGAPVDFVSNIGFTGFDANDLLVTGLWDFSTFTTNPRPVSEPAGFALLALAWLASVAAGLRRRTPNPSKS